jgi:2-dehydropantoate 2-reductase
MRVLCLGAGAIGGYFGGRMAEAGCDVTFLVRPARQAQMAGRLRIHSRFGNADIEVKTITSASEGGPFDIIILTCKAYDLKSALETIASAVRPETAVLPLLNGVAHIEVLNDYFGKGHVLGGVAKIAATVTPDGAINHLNDWRFITFGEQDGTMSARVNALKTTFDKTSVVAEAVTDIMQKMWEKIVHLSTVAGATCTMRASVGQIAQTEYGTSLMIELLEKNAEVSKKAGFPISEALLKEYRKLLSDTTSTYTASMLRDILRGGPIESDHVIGYMMRRAEGYGIDATLHRIIYTNLQAYELERAAARTCR